MCQWALIHRGGEKHYVLLYIHVVIRKSSRTGSRGLGRPVETIEWRRKLWLSGGAELLLVVDLVSVIRVCRYVVIVHFTRT